MSQQTDMSFETAFAELQRIVQQLETGKTTLEESLLLYEQGMNLCTACGQQLEDARSRVSMLMGPVSDKVIVPYLPEAD